MNRIKNSEIEQSPDGIADEELEKKRSPGEKVADYVAIFVGSWGFILFLIITLTVWVLINTYFIIFGPFDPYPYILLNLVVSWIAAFQAPLVLMSQNRQDARDRIRADHDYHVNLKAELEIQSLHEKLDQLSSEHDKAIAFLQDMNAQIQQLLDRSNDRGNK